MQAVDHCQLIPTVRFISMGSWLTVIDLSTLLRAVFGCGIVGSRRCSLSAAIGGGGILSIGFLPLLCSFGSHPLE